MKNDTNSDRVMLDYAQTSAEEIVPALFYSSPLKLRRVGILTAVVCWNAVTVPHALPPHYIYIYVRQTVEESLQSPPGYRCVTVYTLYTHTDNIVHSGRV